MSSVIARLASPIRRLGQALDATGIALQGAGAMVETLSPARSIVALGPKTPKTVLAAFVAPSACLVGDVTLHQDASVWYGSSLRGDVGSIVVGAGASICERAVIHVSSKHGNTVIGAGACIGPLAILHACTVGSHAQIHAGAKVLDGASVGDHAVIMEGAVVTPGKAVPASEVWAGVPARKVGIVSDTDRQAQTQRVLTMVTMGRGHAEQCGKSPALVVEQALLEEERRQKGPDFAATQWGTYRPDPSDRPI